MIESKFLSKLMGVACIYMKLSKDTFVLLS